MGAAQSSSPAAERRELIRKLSMSSGRKVVDDVSVVAAQVFASSELNRFSFEVGVLNVLAMCVTFGAMPHYLWLYATCQFPVLLMLILRKWAAESKLLYLAEFCWILNTLGWLYLAIEALHASPLLTRDAVLWMSEAARLSAARGFFAIANGPLSIAVLLNGNGLVFHDLERTAGFFIHFTPALVSYTMRWRFGHCVGPEAAAGGGGRALAGLFGRSPPAPTPPSGCAAEGILALNRAALLPTDPWQELFLVPLGMYSIWWVCYACWLLSVGHALPARGWGDSSFKDMQPMIEKLFKVPTSKPRAQACCYLLFHLVNVTIIFAVLPPLVYHSFTLHTAWLATLLLSAVHNGASYYHYAFGKKLSRALTKALDQELVQHQETKAD